MLELVFLILKQCYDVDRQTHKSPQNYLCNPAKNNVDPMDGNE